jgi:hypothetical protein
MKLRLALVALTGALAFAAVSAAPAAAQTTGVTLNTACALSGSATGSCTVRLTGFQVVNGQVAAVLQIVNSATGAVVATLTQPLTALTGTCQILTLDIGAIHLDLLGLVIDVSPIHLSITAESGPGNLLGNLLCGIAHLLDNPSGQLQGIVALLNNLLRHGLITAG